MSTTDTGEQRRDQGAASVLAASTAAHRRLYREHAERAIAAFIWENYSFTADDVHNEIPDDIRPHSPNVLPGVILAAVKRGAIRHVGWRKSTRPSRHAATLRVWKGANNP